MFDRFILYDKINKVMYDKNQIEYINFSLNQIKVLTTKKEHTFLLNYPAQTIILNCTGFYDNTEEENWIYEYDLVKFILEDYLFDTITLYGVVKSSRYGIIVNFPTKNVSEYLAKLNFVKLYRIKNTWEIEEEIDDFIKKLEQDEKITTKEN